MNLQKYEKSGREKKNVPLFKKLTNKYQNVVDQYKSY